MKNPKPFVGVNKHGASGVNLVLMVWVEISNYRETYFRMQKDVKLAFDKNGITIPFNQLDVHLDK